MDTRYGKMSDCEICPILATRNNGKDVTVLETEHWRAVLDSDQRMLGKMFVTLRTHKGTIGELTVVEWAELHEVMRQLERAVGDAFQPSHFNWSCLMNNAVVAEQPTHVHWHFHPRYKTSVEFAGEVFLVTELYPPKERTTHPISQELLHTIAAAIQSYLK
jgi:diadenosine tetraphosphate (Ap4A) HIT family hydrolase